MLLFSTFSRTPGNMGAVHLDDTCHLVCGSSTAKGVAKLMSHDEGRLVRNPQFIAQVDSRPSVVGNRELGDRSQDLFVGQFVVLKWCAARDREHMAATLRSAPVLLP